MRKWRYEQIKQLASNNSLLQHVCDAHIEAVDEFFAVGVSIDSRTVNAGAVFMGLVGPNHNGSDFAEAALARGASIIVAQESGDEPDIVSKWQKLAKAYNAVILLVSDSMIMLELMAKEARETSSATFIGITGSVGKTSTKEILRLAVAANFDYVYATEGNYNNHIGVPLTLANLPERTEIAVIEMGMNHKGEIAELTEMVKPDIAIITAIAASHLEFFDSIEDIAHAKAEIFSSMEEGKQAILPADSEYYEILAGYAQDKQLQIHHFAHQINPAEIDGWSVPKDEMMAYMVSYQAELDGLVVKAELDGILLEYMICAFNIALITSSLIALMVVRLLPAGDLAKAALAIAKFKAVAGRGQIRKVTIAGNQYGEAKSVWLIDDSYNAAPIAMISLFETASNFRNALVKYNQDNYFAAEQSYFPDFEHNIDEDYANKNIANDNSYGNNKNSLKTWPKIWPKIWAVLGDMAELGKDEVEIHKALARDIVEFNIDYVLCCGRLMKYLYDELPEERRAGRFPLAGPSRIAAFLSRKVAVGDIVIIKGSHASGLWQLASNLE